jgi:hypothetical protein
MAELGKITTTNSATKDFSTLEFPQNIPSNLAFSPVTSIANCFSAV